MPRSPINAVAASSSTAQAAQAKPAYVMDTLPAAFGGTGGAEQPAKKFKAEAKDTFYTNFYHRVGAPFTLGKITWTRNNANEANIIDLINEKEARLKVLVKKRIKATFNIGTKKSEGRYFINLELISTSGNAKQLDTHLELDITVERQAIVLQRLLDNPDCAQEIIDECEFDWQSAVAVVHDYGLDDLDEEEEDLPF